MRLKGKINKWIENKGYGFIISDQGEKFFVHISAFNVRSPLPKVEDEVSFEVTKDLNDRLQASSVIYMNRSNLSGEPRARLLVKKKDYVIEIFLVIIIGFFGWKYFHHYTATPVQESSPPAVVERLNPPESGVIANDPEPIKPTLPQAKTENMARYSASIPEQKIVMPQRFSCAGKTRCNQMTSCDEAMYYLNNCPGSVTDGDGDGRPCEDQWCGH